MNDGGEREKHHGRDEEGDEALRGENYPIFFGSC